MSTESAEQQGVTNSSNECDDDASNANANATNAISEMEEEKEREEEQQRRRKSMPVRQYLECTVLPLLLKALQKLVLERSSIPTNLLTPFLVTPNLCLSMFLKPYT